MKRIVICCDGTGNEYRATRNTNVVKLYRALTKDDPGYQVVYYDPGVGTKETAGSQTFLLKFLTKLLGLAFGYGMSENITDAYRYLMNTYEEGDQVFLFGFSRGAYTVRALAGMLKMCGLLRKGSDNLVPYALRVHQQRVRQRPPWAQGWLKWPALLLYFFWKSVPDWHRAAGFKKYFTRKCEPYFLGVWDTVKSVGWLRRQVTLPYTRENPDLKSGRHAVSIDERRSQYRPNLWAYKNSEEFQQVWFAGVHSDVGGSYAEDGLSDVALRWMIDAALERGLKFDEQQLSRIRPNPLDKLHNPLWPLWWLLGWRARQIPTGGSLVHRSVQVRMEQTDYTPQAPIPADAVFVD